MHRLFRNGTARQTEWCAQLNMMIVNFWRHLASGEMHAVFRWIFRGGIAMIKRIILFVLSVFALPVAASAATINLNTGTAAWQVTQTSGTDNGLGIGTTSSATVLTGTLPFAANLPGFEAFAWVNPFAGAVWVGQRATDGQFSNGGSITCGSPCGAMAGSYRYTFAFDASLGGSLNFSGFTADNGVRSLTIIQANNTTLYSCTAGGPGTLCAATQNAVTPSFGPLSLLAVTGGVVTITAMVENLDGPGRNPSGFIFAGSATLNDAPAIPEPATWALMLAGFGFVGGAMRRRNGQTVMA
jgi:PEP-CTERM motif